jgi:hypothetical protein
MSFITRNKRLAWAFVIAVAIEFLLLFFSVQASPSVSKVAHWIAFRGLDLARSSALEIQERAVLQDKIYCMLGSVYLMSGFIVTFSVFPWAKIPRRLTVASMMALLAFVIGLWRAEAWN